MHSTQLCVTVLLALINQVGQRGHCVTARLTHLDMSRPLLCITVRIMVVLTDCKAWKSSHSDLPVSLGFGTSSGYLSPCMNLSKVESSDRISFCSDFQVLVGFSDVFLVTLEAGYTPFLFLFLQPQVISALVHCLQKDQKLRWLSS